MTKETSNMRTIVYGAGAVGSVIGAHLFQSGRQVVLIARGAHLDAIRQHGLRLCTPEEDVRLPIAAVAHPRELTFRDDDIVLLTMKTQDTEAALQDLQEAAGTDVPVVSCQNGVENERLIARRFARSYAMLSWVPATYLEPGTVRCEGMPLSAILPVGRYPEGTDATAERLASELAGARMFSSAEPRVMDMKYAKLLFNLGNGVQAITGENDRDDAGRALSRRMRDEALRCFEAAGIRWTSDQAYAALMARSGTAPIAGQARAGGSTWQSLMRGGSVEVDYLNGEITLLGRLHGIPTPANATVQRVCSAMAAAGEKPGRYTAAELLAFTDRASAPSSLG